MGMHSMTMNPAPTTVGARIAQARKNKDMTQGDLSKLVGVSRAAVGQWEINSTSPSIQKIEEVASILNVEPEWLAYNVDANEVKIVYRNPERDNIQWIEEIGFGEQFEDIEDLGKWGFPARYLTEELGTPLDSTVICKINSHAVEPEFEYNDRVFVDRSDKRPSPGGVFCFWDGIGMGFAKMQPVPGAKPKVRVAQKGTDTYDVDLDKIQILGRVKGRIQRG